MKKGSMKGSMKKVLNTRNLLYAGAALTVVTAIDWFARRKSKPAPVAVVPVANGGGIDPATVAAAKKQNARRRRRPANPAAASIAAANRAAAEAGASAGGGLADAADDRGILATWWEGMGDE